jgi:hypothetical protein
MDKDTQQSPKKRGRKLTGRKKRHFYVTDEERDTLMLLLHDIRRGENPILYSAIKERADKEYQAAIKREAQGSYKPVHTIGYYQAAILYDLLEIPYKVGIYKKQVEQMREQLEREKTRERKPLTAEELNAWAERMEEKQRQSWERIKSRYGIE